MAVCIACLVYLLIRATKYIRSHPDEFGPPKSGDSGEYTENNDKYQ